MSYSHEKIVIEMDFKQPFLLVCNSHVAQNQVQSLKKMLSLIRLSHCHWHQRVIQSSNRCHAVIAI